MGDEDDYSFTAQRELGWAMQHVVFGAVMGDAGMVEAALERDVYTVRTPSRPIKFNAVR